MRNLAWVLVNEKVTYLLDKSTRSGRNFQPHLSVLVFFYYLLLSGLMWFQFARFDLDEVHASP